MKMIQTAETMMWPTLPQDLWQRRAFVAKLIPFLTWRRHGIGCLQGYIYEGERQELRVHIWSRALMLDGIEESGNAHNHRFELESSVLYGSLLHTEYHLRRDDERGDHALFTFVPARQQTDENRSEMVPLEGRYEVRKHPMIVDAGWTYLHRRGCYHSTALNTDIAVTLVEKHEQLVNEQARVVAPVSQAPVPAFGGGEVPSNVMESLLRGAVGLLNTKLRAT